MKKELIGIFVCILFIVTSIPISGQITKNILIKNYDEINPSNNYDKWIRIFGGDAPDWGNYAKETSDGGFIVGGITHSFGDENGDIWLIKTDNKGNLIWDGYFGGIFDDFCSDVQETSDGGFIITGYNDTYDKFTQFTLIKVNSDGELIWEKSFGDIQQDCGLNVRELDDGGYISLGFADFDYNVWQSDIWLIKVDNDGNFIWDKKFGDEGNFQGRSFDITDSGDFIIAGLCNISGVIDDYYLWIIKTDNKGEIIWDRTYYNDIYSHGRLDIQQTADGGYIIVGNIDFNSSVCNIWLLKIDSDGEILWEKIFSDFAPYQEAYAIRETFDGGYIIAGKTCCNGYDSDVLIIKTDNQGELLWVNNKELKGGQGIYSVEQTKDGGYIFAGSLGKGWLNSDICDLWLIKADSNGDYPTNRPRNLMHLMIFDLFPNLFPIFKRIIQILV